MICEVWLEPFAPESPNRLWLERSLIGRWESETKIQNQITRFSVINAAFRVTERDFSLTVQNNEESDGNGQAICLSEDKQILMSAVSSITGSIYLSYRINSDQAVSIRVIQKKQ